MRTSWCTWYAAAAERNAHYRPCAIVDLYDCGKVSGIEDCLVHAVVPQLEQMGEAELVNSKDVK